MGEWNYDLDWLVVDGRDLRFLSSVLWVLGCLMVLV